MEEKTYNDFLSTYRKGMDFTLTYINKGNRETSRNLWIDEVQNSEGKPEPQFRFSDSGDVLNPRLIGGVERIISIEEISVQQC